MPTDSACSAAAISAALVRLYLVADIADNHRLAVCGAAFFTMKAFRDAAVNAIGTEGMTSVITFCPMPRPSLSAIRTLEGDSKSDGILHRAFFDL
jgi:hypothetical protein